MVISIRSAQELKEFQLKGPDTLRWKSPYCIDLYILVHMRNFDQYYYIVPTDRVGLSQQCIIVINNIFVFLA